MHTKRYSSGGKDYESNGDVKDPSAMMPDDGDWAVDKNELKD